MAVETVDIEFRARLADFKRELEKLPSLTKKSARELTKEWVDQIKTAEKKAGSSIEAAAKEAEKLEKIATAIGGSVGDGIRQIGALAKGAGAGLGEMGVKLAAIGAVVGSVYLVGSAIGGVLTNIEAYKDAVNSVSDRKLVSDEQIKQLYAASAGWSALGDQVSGLSVRIAAQIAPAFNKFLIGTAYGLEYLTKLASSWSFDEAAKSATAAAREVWAAQQEAARLAEESKKATGEWGRESDISSIAADKARKAAQAAAEAAKADAEAQREAAHAAEWRAQVETALAREQEEAAQLAARLGPILAENANRIDEAANGASNAYAGLGEQIDETTGKAVRSSEQVAAMAARTQQASFDTILAAGQALGSSLAAIADTVADNQIRAAGRNAAAQHRIMRRQFAAQKAVAIANATINTAVAVSKTLSEYAYPTNIILGALTLAAGIAEVAVISAQKPTFHTGGVVQPAQAAAPDEVPATLMAGEGVLTRRGVQALGGEQAVQAVNRGAPMPASSSTVTAIAMLDGRVLDAVWTGAGPSGRGGLASRVDSRLRGGLSGRSQRGR